MYTFIVCGVILVVIKVTTDTSQIWSFCIFFTWIASIPDIVSLDYHYILSHWLPELLHLAVTMLLV